jgi:hypothetical protein
MISLNFEPELESLEGVQELAMRPLIHVMCRAPETAQAMRSLPANSGQNQEPKYGPGSRLIQQTQKSRQLMAETMQFVKTFIAPGGQSSKK